MFPICFAMKMPVYKPEGNKLERIFWLKNELFQSQGIWMQQMPLKDVGVNSEVILRRFYKIVHFSENVIFPKLKENRFKGKIKKSCCFSDLVHHAGHK